jgi:hypothetical protein
VIRVFLPRLQAAARSPIRIDERQDDDSDDGASSDIEDPTERTPLVPSSTSAERATAKSSLAHLAPVLIASALGLLICLIKPVQHALIGHDVREGDFTGSWRSIGFGLSILGASFAVVDLLADGMNARAGEKKA